MRALRCLAAVHELLFRLGLDLRGVETRRLANHVLGAAALQAGWVGLGLLSSILLARLLGAEGLGVYSLGMAVATLALPLSTTGVSVALVQLLPSYNTTKSHEYVRGCLRWAYTHTISASLVIVMLVYCVSFLVSWPGPQYAPTLLLGLSMLPLWAFSEVQAAVLQGAEKIFESRISILFVRPFIFIILLAFAYFTLKAGTLSAENAMTFQLISSAISCLCGMYFVKSVSDNIKAVTGTRYAIKNWYRKSFFLLYASIACVVIEQSSILIASIFSDARELGLFRAALSASQLINMPLVAVNVALAPVVSRLFVPNQINELQHVITVFARLSLLCCTPIALALVLFGDSILVILYGVEFSEAYYLLIIMTVGPFLSTATGSSNWILKMTGHEAVESKIWLFVAVCHVISMFAMVKYFGIYGCAIVVSGFRVASAFLLMRAVLGRVGIDPSCIGWRKIV